MSLVYITGISGAGKSTVRGELQKRGYKAYDTDEGGFRSWYNLRTKQMVDAQIGYNDASKDWLASHHLYIKRDAVKKIIPKNPTKLVFLCGTVPNDKDVWDLFNKVVYLMISEDTLHHRIHSRTNNKFGKDPEEYKAILGWHKDQQATADRVGAITIDAEQTVEHVVEDILKTLVPQL